MLEDLVSQGFKFWKEISSKISGRSAKQCRERWQQNLQPTLRRTAFTVAEDAMILQMQRDVGNKWTVIGKQLTGRSVCPYDYRVNMFFFISCFRLRSVLIIIKILIVTCYLYIGSAS